MMRMTGKLRHLMLSDYHVDESWAFLRLGGPFIVRGFADDVNTVVLSHGAWNEVLACAMMPSFGTAPNGSFHWLIYE